MQVNDILLQMGGVSSIANQLGLGNWQAVPKQVRIF